MITGDPNGQCGFFEMTYGNQRWLFICYMKTDISRSHNIRSGPICVFSNLIINF